MTLMLRKRLQLLKSMTGPNDDFGIETDGDEDRGVVGPCEVLYIVVVTD
jgi:hypothetical protein